MYKSDGAISFDLVEASVKVLTGSAGNLVTNPIAFFSDLNQIGSAVFLSILAVPVILLFMYFTAKLFLVLKNRFSRSQQIYTLLTILMIILISKISLHFTSNPFIFHDGVLNTCVYVGLFFIANFWWPIVIILPTLFIYPDLQEKNLWKDVGLCFFITLFLRSCIEYLFLFPLLAVYSDFAPFSDTTLTYYVWVWVGMVIVTLGLAYFGYWIIHELKQRVPQ